MAAGEWLVALAVLITAYLVRGITGFGSGMIAIPPLAMLLPLATVVPMIALLDYLAALFHGVSQRHMTQWRDLLPLIPSALLGVGCALALYSTVDGEQLTRVLGFFIFLYAIYSLWAVTPKRLISRRWAILAGYFGGLVDALFGTGGPFYIIYLQARGIDKGAVRATFATTVLLSGSSRITGYAMSGFYNRELLLMALAAVPLMALSLYFGGRIHTNISQQRFRQIIALVLIGSGLTLMVK